MRLDGLPKTQSGADGNNRTTSFFMGVFQLRAVAAPCFFTCNALLVAILFWWVSGSLGIGMGYHWLLAHRGY